MQKLSNSISIYRKLIIIIIILFAFIATIGFLLPRRITIEEKIQIKASKEYVFKKISNYYEWKNWMTLDYNFDTSLKVQHTGFSGEEGSSSVFFGEKIGKGKITTTKVIKNQIFAYKLIFESGKYNTIGKFELIDKLTHVNLIWSTTCDLGYNPLNRYLGIFIKRKAISYSNESLLNLKKILQNNE
ncbi:MAG: hypothetical protein M0R21_13615 [Lentimicrobiaceae bacterium]|nr:hypothetical protein [Lentimicrobiaceae bacterium]